MLFAGFLLFPGDALWGALFTIIISLGLANLVWFLRTHKSEVRRCAGAIDFATWQILVDFALLAIAVHLTGGITSPLVPLFILHGVFSAILLPTRLAIRVIILTVLLIAASLVLGHLGLGVPVWEFGPDGVAPRWIGELARFAFLVVSLAGATLQGLDLSREIRNRYARITHLAHELELRNDELRQVDEQRVRLLGTASHDLRSPLAAVESHIELFLGDYVPDVTTIQKAYLRRMKERLQGLRLFINDLLDLTAIESKGTKTAELRRFDVVAQVMEIVTEQRPLAEGLGLEIVTELPDEPIHVSAPPGHLLLVWTNLISNAIKYGAGRSPLKVTIRKENGHVAVSVQDSGLGISQEDLAKLFTDYFRSPSVKKAGIPGTGLGLSIARRVVEGVGGHIDVATKLGEGSTFTIVLPMAPPEGDSVAKSDRAPQTPADSDSHS